MYHYVRERGAWKGIHPLLPHEFEQQVNKLSKKYQVISIEDLNKPNRSQKPRCLLTFDDGTKDQYEVAFQILNKKGIPAYFAVMSGPLQARKIPVVHLSHAVLSFYSDEEIWEKLNTQYSAPDIHEKSFQYYHYEPERYRRYNKYMLNVMLSEIEARCFLEELFGLIFPSTEKFINDFYINQNELQAMVRAGMTIGVHCHHHLFYQGDAEYFYQQEIAPCKKYLEEIDIFPKWYTPAFGGGLKLKEMKRDLTPILQSNGFVGGHTTVSRNIDPAEPFWIDRYDCNNLLLEMEKVK